MINAACVKHTGYDSQESEAGAGGYRTWANLLLPGESQTFLPHPPFDNFLTFKAKPKK